MPGAKQRSGGARPGSGPIHRRFTISPPGALFLREETRSRLRKKDVSKEEITSVLESILMDHARNLHIPDDDGD